MVRRTPKVLRELPTKLRGTYSPSQHKACLEVWAELFTVAAILRVAHPPGLPLLALLGHIFSHLPLEPAAFRLNLSAAVCGAGTVALIYLTSRHLTGRRLAAALAACGLAVNPLFWS